jgi:hypothetical protein
MWEKPNHEVAGDIVLIMPSLTWPHAGRHPREHRGDGPFTSVPRV